MPRALPSLNALLAFEAAARLGSVSRAATELHVTHGAVSRHIRALEQDLGTSLFQRQGRGLALTPAGQRLRETSTAAFVQLRETCDELRSGTAHAPFVLGCPVSLLARWMIPRLERLMEELPELDLHLRPQETSVDETLAGLDAAIMAGEPPWPAGWQVTVLANERIGPVASPGYAKAQQFTRSRPQAVQEQMLLHTQSRPEAWDHWAQSMGLPAKQLTLGQGYPHLYHMIEAAVAGRGLAIAPAQLVAGDLASGRLLAPWGFHEIRPQWVLVTSARVSDARVAPLAEWLKAAFAEQGS